MNKMDNAPTAKMNDVPLACEELAKSVYDLDEVLMHFQNRLNSITRQETTKSLEGCSVGCPVKSSVCELSGTIRDQANRLREMSERIRSHSAALEL